MGLLAGKRICVACSGSVAIIQSIYIIRELMRLGCEVYCVVSHAAQELIHPNLLHWASGNPVITKLTGGVEHVSLAGNVDNNVDLVLVCPATANTISKIACGIDDTPVTTIVTTAFGSKIPIVIVPAMHYSMFEHPIVRQNIRKLRDHGVIFLGPRIEENKAKIEHVDEIVTAVVKILKTHPTQDLDGKKILITAGPTREYIDGVRFITNPSTGRMGIAIAREAVLRGADEVTIVYGPGTAELPQNENVKIIHVISAEEMNNAVRNELEKDLYDAFICSAAIADYTPVEMKKYKIRSQAPDGLTVQLKTTDKCIEVARNANSEVSICAFKAEYNVPKEDLIEQAFKGLQKYKADLIIANDVGKEKTGFQYETNEVYIIDKDKNVDYVPLEDKNLIATKIIDQIVKKLRERKKGQLDDLF
ncbi:MAG: bifunctional phosphopantothenoylcysteine decarboxylase/phosphopantothenate--cysteine ligase CoaBC [Candidatus Lokiarchaeota archaeon]|nr:bifunctional phosphopantothenoylcysteine decarboxylase/phosphopantothenate--cysteine ligase CoaBC [Candidatus Lokiarchaeota archaeon]